MINNCPRCALKRSEWDFFLTEAGGEETRDKREKFLRLNAAQSFGVRIVVAGVIEKVFKRS